MDKYMKLVHYVVVTVLASGVGVPLLQGEGFNLVTLVAVLGAVGVWWKANTPTQPHAKALVASYVAGVTVLAATVEGGITAVEWQQILLAFLGRFAVRDGANNPPGPNGVTTDGGHVARSGDEPQRGGVTGIRE